jgi:LuxR family transcriptional regulator, transcriptional activator of the bioluminescence operon
LVKNLKDKETMNINLFHDIHEKLALLENEDQLKELCQDFCEASDFEFYLIGICTLTSLSSPQVSTITNYPGEWFESYVQKGLQKHDPVVKYCFQNTTPIRWDKLIEMPDYVDPIGAQIMEHAASFGLVNGISIPIKSPTGDIAIFSLATKCDADFNQKAMAILPHAQNFGMGVYEAYSRMRLSHSTEPRGSHLTPREKECLFWACEGKTTWEISTIIAVSERTVIFHLTSATKKLGAINRQHAVAKAIMSGLIQPIF